MKSFRRSTALMGSLVSAFFAAAALTGPAAANDYPTRAITIINPSAAGAASDISARRLAEGLSEILGQPVVVESRPGAGGGIGSEYVARATPDGYTLIAGTVNTHGINAGLYSNLPYDPVADFIPITRINSFSNVFVVPADSEAQTFEEFIELAKASPDAPKTFASGGIGTSMHLLGELITAEADIPYQHIPYPGSSNAMPDLLAGRVDSFFAGLSLLKPHIDSGALRPLAVSGTQRIPSLPDVPTVGELGYDGVEMEVWIGFFAPAGTPDDVIEKLSAASREVLSRQALIEQFEAEGSSVENDAPEEFAELVASGVERWKRLAAELGLAVD